MQFCPSIYEHAARVLNMSPWEVSRRGDLIVAAHVRAYEMYRHRPIVVGIDIYNLEAEAYGATVDEPSANGIPAIHKHPFSTTAELLKLEPFDPASAGRIGMIIGCAKEIARKCPDAEVRVPLAGPFSVATNLMGFENLLSEIITDPDSVARALNHLIEGQTRFCRQIKANDLDIAFFESAAAPPLLSPAQFRKIELPALQSIMQRTAAIVGHAVPCIIGGDTYPILDAILETGTGYVCCPLATDQAAFMRKMRDMPDVTVRINMDPGPLASKNFRPVQNEVDRVIALADNRPNICLGTGCLPYEADPETVIKAREYIQAATAQQ